ncbi:MAG: DUF6498-containing protein [Rudaea sp.]
MTNRWDDVAALHADDRVTYDKWYREHMPPGFDDAPRNVVEFTPAFFVSALASSLFMLAGVLFFGWNATTIVLLVALECLIVLIGDFVKAGTVPIRTAGGRVARAEAQAQALFFVPWIFVAVACLIFAAFPDHVGSAIRTTLKSPGLWSAVAAVLVLQALKIGGEMRRALGHPSVPAYLSAAPYAIWLICAAGLIYWARQSGGPRSLHDMAIAAALALIGVRVTGLLIGAYVSNRIAQEGVNPADSPEIRDFEKQARGLRRKLISDRRFR